MTKKQLTLERINSTIATAADLGLLHRTVENERLTGQQMVLDGRSVLNFGWGGYMGLEFDPRLIEGAVNAARSYGVQFASSRAYISSPLYRILEHKLSELVGSEVLVTSTMTLGHQSCMPVAIGPRELVLIDDAAHECMRQLAPTLMHKGAVVRSLPHSDLEELRARLESGQREHPKIWYVVDGIYSMRGDCTPLKALMPLLEQYPCLHLYIDDAHAMSWTGERGTGYALRHTLHHPRTIVGLSMAKAFGAGGAFFVIPDEQLRRNIRNCGTTMLFSGPLQNPILGACIASAEVHLSGEIHDMQGELQRLLAYTRELLAKFKIEQSSAEATPIFFIEIGGENETQRLVRRLLDLGFYVNFAVFPAVPRGHSGIRFNITRSHTRAQINAFITTLAELVSH